MRVTSRLVPFLLLTLAATLWPLAARAAQPPPGRRDRYPPRRYRVEPNATVRARLLITPKQAEVYLDGYYAGLVDEYDGFFQGLQLRPGPHTIVVYAPGYRTVHEHLVVTKGAAYTLRYKMSRLARGEVSEPPPAAPTPRPVRVVAPPGGESAPGAVPSTAPPPRPAPAEAPGFGTLLIHVQPADAQIWIDGERWRGAAGTDGLVVQVADGLHTVEVRRDGYRSFSVHVRVHARATTPLNVSLPPRNP